MRHLLFAVLTLAALSANAQTAHRVVVAEIESEAIRPLLSPAQVAHLVSPLLDDAEQQARQRDETPGAVRPFDPEREMEYRPRFEQSWIERGAPFRLRVDAQFPDGNDFVAGLPLEEIRYGEKRLLVLVRPAR